jgi:serine/threonine protein kinase
MKEFKLRNDEEQSLRRLEQEINVLQENRPGLPKLLGSNVNERWMVTEYFAAGTLEDHILEYKGNPALTLKAFQSLVRTVSLLHKEGIVHRDIKPANVFVRKDHELVLGDFGLVFVPERQRLTFDGETVGARDFIPLWGEEGNRLDHVKPDFDVYMLGKVLWCMVSGSSVLRRERFMKPDNDVTKLFPYDPHTYMINDILRHCVVEEQKDCFSSADDLLLVVDTYLEVIKQRGQLLNDGIPRPCHVCGLGHYARQAHDKNDPV